MLTNAGMDMAALAAEQEKRRISAEFDAAHEVAEKKAMIQATGAPNQNIDIVEQGSEADLLDQFSYDRLDEALELKRIREARAYGNLRPAQYLTDGDKYLGPKMRNQNELNAVAQGIFCWNCGDSQPEDEHILKERFEKLRRFMGYELPPDKTERDCCATCGRILKIERVAC